MTRPERQARLHRLTGQKPTRLASPAPDQTNVVLGSTVILITLVVGWCLRGVIWWLLVGVFYLGVAVLVVLFLIALGGIAVLLGAGDLISGLGRRFR